MSQYNPKAFWDNAAQDPDVRYKYIADEWATTDEFLIIIEQCNKNWGKVLEIGCGIGRLLDPLSAKYETCQFFGVDISTEMLKLSPRKHNIHYTEKIEARGLDLVYSMLVFQHIPMSEKAKYIVEAYEALKPGGTLLIQFVVGEENTPYSYQVKPEVMYELLYYAGFNSISTRTDLMHPDWAFIQAVKV